MSKESKARFRTCGWTGGQGDQDPRKESVDMKEGYRPAARRREKGKGGGGGSRDSPRPAGRCWVDIGSLASAGEEPGRRREMALALKGLHRRPEARVSDG